MALATKVNITIDGKELPDFTQLHINERMMNHHSFEIICRMDKLEGTDNFSMEKSQDFIGGQIIIKIEADSPKRTGDHTFRGLITEVTANRNYGVYGDSIILKGYSPDIILDDNPHSQSFEEKDLEGIFNEILKSYDKGFLKPDMSMQSSDKLAYTVQYRETSFNFMLRNCALRGEWWCYTGDKLFIGELPDNETELTYGIDMHDFDFSISLQPTSIKYNSYNYLSAKSFNSSSKSVNVDSSQNRYGKTAISKSDDIYPNEKLSLFNQNITDGNEQKDIDNRVKLEKESRASRVVNAQGISENLNLMPGCKAQVKGFTEDFKDEVDYGEYLITSIQHSCDREGNYENRFDAIPSTVIRPPLTNIHAIPKCDEQSAVVKDVKDPEKMGRVRVQFHWQQDNDLSPWLRIITPSGGADKGMYLIPEEDEEVLVGFKDLNAEKPYIIGSFYNGKNKPDKKWVTDKNDFKGFRTRSGHTILISDEKGKEYINIYDKDSTNIINFNPVDKELTISSEGDIFVNAKNIELSARKDIVMKADGEINLKTKKDYKLEAMGNINEKATKDSKLEAMNINRKANIKYSAQGTQSELKGSAMTTIKGAIVKIN